MNYLYLVVFFGLVVFLKP